MAHEDSGILDRRFVTASQDQWPSGAVLTVPQWNMYKYSHAVVYLRTAARLVPSRQSIPQRQRMTADYSECYGRQCKSPLQTFWPLVVHVSCAMHVACQLASKLCEIQSLTSSFVFFEDGVCCLGESFLGGAMSGSVTTPFFCSGESCLSLMADSSFSLSGRRLKWH